MKKLTGVLVLIGALNWGLVGFFKFDLVAQIFGDMSGISRIIYMLVGLSAVYMLVKGCGCGKGKCGSGKCGSDKCGDGTCSTDHNESSAPAESSESNDSE